MEGDLSTCGHCGKEIALITSTELGPTDGGDKVIELRNSFLDRKDGSKTPMAIETAGGFKCPDCGQMNFFGSSADPSLS